jgi:hypothetical protein
VTNLRPPLRLGIIGLSDGNGHPYSWSAIFNGYDPETMRECPFPSIPAYLAERSWPEDSLREFGTVTHIWTQDRQLSDHVSRASRIANIVGDPEDMLGSVDGLLLARDDCENHRRFAEPFLLAGLPVYVDKPLALTPEAAQEMLALQTWEGQLFSCSALRFAPELVPGAGVVSELGPLRRIEGRTPKTWEKYAVHVVEPAVVVLAEAGLLEVPTMGVTTHRDGVRTVEGQLGSELVLTFSATGDTPSAIELILEGERSSARYRFSDSFTAFRSALELFVRGVQARRPMIPRDETLRVMEILSWGA